MSNCQVHIFYVILIYHLVQCQYGIGKYAVSLVSQKRNFLPPSRDYFVPRRMAMNRRQRSLPRVSKLQGLEGGCNCRYSYAEGGCMIFEGADEGYACQCSYVGFWTCVGNARLCASKKYEDCPAGCTSLLCCIKGRGNCKLLHSIY